MGICFSSSKKTSAKAKENTPASPKQKQRNSSTSQSQNQTQNRNQQQEKAGVKRTTSVAQVPCGKRTNFGYHRDFENNYAIGKLLGHGQFGYTFVATHKVNGKKVAVKRIDKSKVDRFLRGLPKDSLGFSLSLLHNSASLATDASQCCGGGCPKRSQDIPGSHGSRERRSVPQRI